MGLIYFPQYGEVGIDLSDYKGSYHLKWMDILSNEWIEESSVDGGEIIQMKTPGERHYLLLVMRNSQL